MQLVFASKYCWLYVLELLAVPLHCPSRKNTFERRVDKNLHERTESFEGRRLACTEFYEEMHKWLCWLRLTRTDSAGHENG